MNMQPAVMIDSAQPVTAADIAAKPIPGVVAVARPLFAGATDAQGNVPDPIATPLTAAEVATIHAAGLAVLPYVNNLGWGDLPNAETVASKVAAAMAQATAIGVPNGCYLAWDLEDWDCPPASLSAIAGGNRASRFGGAGLPYFGAASPTVAVWQQLRATDPNVARMLLWIASWDGWTPGGAIPAWSPGVDDPAVTGWQFTDKGKAGPLGVDVSILRLPLLSIGSVIEGFWLPDGSVGSPTLPVIAQARSDLSAVAQAVAKAQADLGA